MMIHYYIRINKLIFFLYPIPKGSQENQLIFYNFK